MKNNHDLSIKPTAICTECLAVIATAIAATSAAEETILWPSTETELRAQQDSVLAPLPDGTAEVKTGVEFAYPGVRMDFLAGDRDLSPFGSVTVSVSNTADRAETVQLSVKGETVQGQTPGVAAKMYQRRYGQK